MPSPKLGKRLPDITKGGGLLVWAYSGCPPRASATLKVNRPMRWRIVLGARRVAHKFEVRSEAGNGVAATGIKKRAPYDAGAVMLPLLAIHSYLHHEHFHPL